jgi:hypothetical protein
MRPIRSVLLLSWALMGAVWAQAQTATSAPASVESKSKKATKPKPKPKKAELATGAAAVAAAGAVGASALAPSGLPPELQAIADQIHTGRLPCELGQTVTLLPDAREPGRFNLFLKQHVYQLMPVQSATGALRLEDPAKGAVWIQLADKSMLMNNQLGQRMADMCQSAAQMQVAAAHKLAPPPSLLESSPGSGLAQK